MSAPHLVATNLSLKTIWLYAALVLCPCSAHNSSVTFCGLLVPLIPHRIFSPETKGAFPRSVVFEITEAYTVPVSRRPLRVHTRPARAQNKWQVLAGLQVGNQKEKRRSSAASLFSSSSCFRRKYRTRVSGRGHTKGPHTSVCCSRENFEQRGPPPLYI